MTSQNRLSCDFVGAVSKHEDICHSGGCSSHFCFSKSQRWNIQTIVFVISKTTHSSIILKFVCVAKTTIFMTCLYNFKFLVLTLTILTTISETTLLHFDLNNIWFIFFLITFRVTECTRITTMMFTHIICYWSQEGYFIVNKIY